MVVAPSTPADEVPSEWADGTHGGEAATTTLPRRSPVPRAGGPQDVRRAPGRGRHQTGVHGPRDQPRQRRYPRVHGRLRPDGLRHGRDHGRPGRTSDYDFAQAYELPVVYTVQPPEGHEGAWTGDGVVVNSSSDRVSLDGLDVEDAKARITAWLEEHGVGKGTVTYRLRDWLFSRQRYWGEPFPIVYDEHGQPVALPESMLPVDLPEVPDYSPRTFEPDDASELEPPLGCTPTG